MKNFIILLICLMGLTNVLFSQTPRIEIHHIGAGDGDATLIIAIDEVDAKNIYNQNYLDTAVVLIDGQRSGKEVWRYVRDTVNALSPNLKKIDCIVLSHLHIDHFGGLAYVMNEATKAGWKIGKVLDRQHANYTKYFKPERIADDCYDLDAPLPDLKNFNKYLSALVENHLTPTIAPIPGNDVFKALFNFKHMSMFCIVSNGVTLATNPEVADTCFLPRVSTTNGYLYKPKSENDLSIGFLIEFQGFHYLTLGDLGGISGGYTDGETPVTRWLQHALGPGYHICANKVSHHGSEESTSPWFATTNNFTVSVIPASLRSYGKSQNALPTESAITNLGLIPEHHIRYTFIPKNPQTPSSFWTKGNLDKYNDVILKVNGLPGYGKTIVMQEIQHAKSKKGVYQGPATVDSITCDKGHSDN